MKRRYLLYGGVIINIFFNTYGYIYQLSVMKKDNYSKPRLIIGIGDYHDKDHPANKSQREYLESLLKALSHKKIKLIVEDLSSINNDGKGVCCNYAINAQGGVLGKLADAARSQCIDVDNVEYRFCRVVGLGPLLNNVHNKPRDFNVATSLTMNELYNEIKDELNRVSCYEDGHKINSLYKRIVTNVSKIFAQLNLDGIRTVSIADYCSRFLEHEYKKHLEKLCTFDSSLIDAKIFHSIVISQDKDIIIVAAGGTHIDKINTFLKMLGYKKEIIASPNSHKYQAIESTLNSGNKENKTASRPLAIELNVLEKYLHQ